MVKNILFLSTVAGSATSVLFYGGEGNIHNWKFHVKVFLKFELEFFLEEFLIKNYVWLDNIDVIRFYTNIRLNICEYLENVLTKIVFIF